MQRQSAVNQLQSLLRQGHGLGSPMDWVQNFRKMVGWVGFGNTVTYKMWPDNSNFRLAGKNMHKSFPFCLKLPGVSFASRLVQLSQNEIFQQLDTQ